MATFRRNLAFLMLLLSVSAPLLAKSRHRWPEGSAVYVGYLHIDREKRVMKRLQKKHRELISLVGKIRQGQDPRLLEALKAQQERWIQYREAECELEGALSGAGGSWPTTYNLECQADRTEERYRTVVAAVECLQGRIAQKREVYYFECIDPLMALDRRPTP